MLKAKRIAVVGATGMVGQTFLNLLQNDFYPDAEIVLLASKKSAGKIIEFRKKEYEVAESLFKKGFRSEVKLSESRTNFENALALYEKSQVELNNTKILKWRLLIWSL